MQSILASPISTIVELPLLPGPLAVGDLGGALDLLGVSAAVIAQGEGAGPSSFLLPMIAIMLLAYFMLLRPQQNSQRQYQEMIDNLKTNDRVVTTGGIHGTITSVQRDSDYVTLRIDDSTGTKIRVDLASISHLLGDKKQDKASGQGDRGKQSETKNKK